MLGIRNVPKLEVIALVSIVDRFFLAVLVEMTERKKFETFSEIFCLRIISCLKLLNKC